jgi:hypothetical protein
LADGGFVVFPCPSEEVEEVFYLSTEVAFKHIGRRVHGRRRHDRRLDVCVHVVDILLCVVVLLFLGL